jgi:hypothetical protein
MLGYIGLNCVVGERTEKLQKSFPVKLNLTDVTYMPKKLCHCHLSI